MKINNKHIIKPVFTYIAFIMLTSCSNLGVVEKKSLSASPPPDAVKTKLLNSSPPNVVEKKVEPPILIESRPNVFTVKKTGLMWKKCVEGYAGARCEAGVNRGISWYEAINKARSSRYGGFRNWRVPSKNEMLFVISQNKSDFPDSNKTNFFWTSSTLPNNKDLAIQIRNNIIATPAPKNKEVSIYADRRPVSVRLVRYIKKPPLDKKPNN